MGCSSSADKNKKRVTVKDFNEDAYKRGTYSHILFKILVLGDASVGKSSILSRYTSNEFNDTPISTIGIDFQIISQDIDGEPMKVQIWDTAGEERYRTITSSYYRGAHGILLVYDITNPHSYESLPKWLEEVERYAYENIVIVLVGNKVDRESERKIPKEDIQAFADTYKIKHIETSAKQDIKVQEAFITIIRDIKEKAVYDESITH